ncbi:MAG: hypothetical protein IIX73_05515 [Clostridia bacterium]|nr:hypothetical protein [Clostridia bacterium]MBQ5900301.1 hypothetical protein [Clostridia bacterium]
MVGFEQGGRKPLAFGRKQFRELFSPTWATSVSEAIGALRRKNPLLSAKIKGHILFVCVLLFLIDYGRDSNKGGLPYGKLQPFGEWLQSPWATSVSEAIGALRRKNPLLSAKKDESVRKDGFFFFMLIW